MKVSMKKLDIALASQCKTASNLRPGISPQTLQKIKRGEEIRSDSAGRIARALGIDVVDIIEEAKT